MTDGIPTTEQEMNNRIAALTPEEKIIWAFYDYIGRLGKRPEDDPELYKVLSEHVDITDNLIAKVMGQEFSNTVKSVRNAFANLAKV